MAATPETIVELGRPADAAQEMARLNDRLARERTIPPEIAEAVHQIAAVVVDEASMAGWEAIDPYLTLIIHRAVIQAEEAARQAEDTEARDQLRIALESLRQGFSGIAETEPVVDERSPKEIARWLTEVTEVPQNRLAELLGVSLRQFQRWVSTQEAAQPIGEDARRVRAVARVVNQLRFALTAAGAVEWFSWPRDDLQGRRPIELLGEPDKLPELTAVAGRMRGTHAS